MSAHAPDPVQINPRSFARDAVAQAASQANDGPAGHDVARHRLRAARRRSLPGPAAVFNDPTPSVPTPIPLTVCVDPPFVSLWWGEVVRYARAAFAADDEGSGWECNIQLGYAVQAISRAHHDPEDLTAAGKRRADPRHPTVRAASALVSWRDERATYLLAGREQDDYMRGFAQHKIDLLAEFLFHY